MIVMTKLTLDKIPRWQKTNKKPSVCPLTDFFFPRCLFLQTALFRLVLQSIEFALLAVEPHEGYGSDERQGKREDRFHNINSTSYY